MELLGFALLSGDGYKFLPAGWGFSNNTPIFCVHWQEFENFTCAIQFTFLESPHHSLLLRTKHAEKHVKIWCYPSESQTWKVHPSSVPEYQAYTDIVPLIPIHLSMIYMKLQKNEVLLPCYTKGQPQPLTKTRITSVFTKADIVHFSLNIHFHHLLKLSSAK